MSRDEDAIMLLRIGFFVDVRQQKSLQEKRTISRQGWADVVRFGFGLILKENGAEQCGASRTRDQKPDFCACSSSS